MAPNPPTIPENAGILYLVATPIGHLGDISSRARLVLSKVDFIACEDTRHTRKLLAHLDIHTPLKSYYKEKEQHQSSKLVTLLLQGKNLALVSDAGTPGLCDPGAILVRKARKAGIAITSIPGPSALTTAIALAGLEESKFYFGGFLPPKKQQRLKEIKQLSSISCPLIFYEAPHRTLPFLQDCLTLLGDRQAILFRELTKVHEQVISGTLSSVIATLSLPIKGEVVVIIAGAPDKKDNQPEDLRSLLYWYHDTAHSTLREAVTRISDDLNIPRTQVYRIALEIWNSRKRD